MPLDVSFSMFWPDGRRATAHCSFVHAFRQWAEVVGPCGTITLDDFVLPKSSHQVIMVVLRVAISDTSNFMLSTAFKSP